MSAWLQISTANTKKKNNKFNAKYVRVLDLNGYTT